MDVGHDRSRQNNSSSPDSNNELLPSMSPDKLEFYKTYDVMTGVRIAATLGGFFSLMVLLVVYKSKCKSRSVSEEDLAAVAAAVVEEEERKETERRLSLYGGGRGQTGTRGRGASLAPGPPFAYHPPLPVGVYTRHHSLTPSPPMAIYNQEEEDDIPEVWRGVPGKRPGMQHLLRVPSSRRSSRRFSSVTCSSCDSSYLERRGSALEIGHPIPPPFINTSNSDRLDEEPWDYYYPIDIQVIQPTPQVSPCSSQATLHGGRGIGEMEIAGDIGWRTPSMPLTHLTCPVLPRSSGVAPLAAHDPRSELLNLSASPHFSSPDRQSSPQQTDQERSLGSDSVFLDEELVDTEDEVDGFSTDSESGSSPGISTGSSQTAGSKIPSRLAGGIPRPPNPQPSSPLASHQHLLFRHRVPGPAVQQQRRRYSSPTGLEASSEIGESVGEKVSSTTLAPADLMAGNDKCKKTSSDSDTLLATPALRNVRTSTIETRTFMSISCDRLVESLQRSQSDLSKDSVQHCAWSQETLF
ncbi:uncharacterized protein isoform X1 [Rhodnius prolixus]